MQNRFVKAIQNNLAYDEGFHTEIPLTKNDSIVDKIISLLDVKKFMKFNQLDLTNITKHIYRGARYYAVLIPVLNRNTEAFVSVLVSNSDEDSIKTQLFTMDYSSNLELRYEDLNGNLEVTGTFNNEYELIQYERASNGDVTTLDLADCLLKEWGNLPWYIQAACGGSCATCFGVVVPACVVCAGCLVGFGINC